MSTDIASKPIVDLNTTYEGTSQEALTAYNAATVQYDLQAANRYDVGFDEILLNQVEASDGNVSSIVSTLAPEQEIPQDVQESINTALSEGDARAAAELTSPYTDLYSTDELENIYAEQDVSVAGLLEDNESSSIFPDPYIVGTDYTKWSQSGTGSYEFSYINSVEELQAEFRALQRPITEIIVHWTDTFTNKNLSAEQIDASCRAISGEGIPYHLVIRRDGTLQRGRPLGEQSTHTTRHNTNTIAVAFVGGYNCPTGTPSPENYKSVASLTRSQFNTFDQLVSSFYTAVPGGQILGHNDVDVNNDDPGFDVIEYCETRFGKKSIYNDPTSQDTFSLLEINSESTYSSDFLRYEINQ